MKFEKFVWEEARALIASDEFNFSCNAIKSVVFAKMWRLDDLGLMNGYDVESAYENEFRRVAFSMWPGHSNPPFWNRSVYEIDNARYKQQRLDVFDKLMEV